MKHDRVGPLFQGRFKSVPVENGEWAYELSLYVHLNPLRLARFKLSRVERQAGAMTPEEGMTRPEATRQLREALAVGSEAFTEKVRGLVRRCNV